MFKKIFSSPALLFLIAANLYCIWYYQKYTDGFATIVWIYWFQSVIIGLFNFVDLLTIKNFSTANFQVNKKPVQKNAKGCIAWFFLFHYGAFHFAYMIFLLVQVGVLSVNFTFLFLGVLAFLFESTINFIRRKQQEKVTAFNIGTLFFLPYVRIVPMHLMILGPAFLGWKPSLVFLILKMGADIISLLLYNIIFNKNKSDSATQ